MKTFYMSFGTNCAPSFHIKKRQNSPTYFFDNIRSSFESISLIIDGMIINDDSIIKDLVDINNQIRHPKYFLIMPHDKDLLVTIDRYTRRFHRTRETLINKEYNQISLLCYIEENQPIPSYEDTGSLSLKLQNMTNKDILLKIIASEDRILKFNKTTNIVDLSNVQYIGLPIISDKFEWTRGNLDWRQAFDE